MSCVLFVLQSAVNSLEGEVHQLKDNLLLQKRRAAENLMSLLKDLNDIGAMFSSDLDLKVSFYPRPLFISSQGLMSALYIR